MHDLPHFNSKLESLALVLLALSSEHSVAQGIALSTRLLLQLGYDLSLSRISSKALVLVAALCMNLIFIYYSGVQFNRN